MIDMTEVHMDNLEEGDVILDRLDLDKIVACRQSCCYTGDWNENRNRNRNEMVVYMDRYNMARVYRHRKSEIIANLLYTLWDTPPTDYDYKDCIYAKWNLHIMPLVHLGLDLGRVESEVKCCFT